MLLMPPSYGPHWRAHQRPTRVMSTTVPDTQELLRMVRQGRREEAGTLLQHLRQDLGMESTSLDDVLYRYASFRNLVDPITHDLIISLARYIHCPKPP